MLDEEKLDLHFRKRFKIKKLILYIMVSLTLVYVYIIYTLIKMGGSPATISFYVYINTMVVLSLLIYILYEIYTVNKNMTFLYYKYKDSESNGDKEHYYYMLLSYVLIHSHETVGLLQDRKGDRYEK